VARLIPIIVAEARHADTLRTRLPSKHGLAEFHTAAREWDEADRPWGRRGGCMEVIVFECGRFLCCWTAHDPSSIIEQLIISSSTEGVNQDKARARLDQARASRRRAFSGAVSGVRRKGEDHDQVARSFSTDHLHISCCEGQADAEIRRLCSENVIILHLTTRSDTQLFHLVGPRHGRVGK
jgi:hypothetical protein